ncbi:SIMPL domain-containing protein [Asanoa sp. WMMD1127]|uniref:SIMPL domain-containing protein n=1 Tax=Asanoa sp. WMMD1127 TaxID=3016107 RepID=UPI002417C05F|nr:SIMPL domain-containing protein [Asanoa sp. WMMD1127]MDG4822909.1 SIMPL domain-containing protein [Asanoa sp. WMMD1127]
MADPVVAVRGEAVHEVPPELARFSVTVVARDKDRETTLRRLAERADATRALIDGYGAAVERRESGNLQVYPERKRAGEKVAAYHGSVTTTVTVTDFGVLGDLMLRLADQDQTSVGGPWWELRPGSPAHRAVRRAAIDDAIVVARDYAAALGARITALVEVADAGMRPQPMYARAAATDAMEMGGGAPVVDLDPQVQTVHAAIEARFTISEPTALAQTAGHESRTSTATSTPG